MSYEDEEYERRKRALEQRKRVRSSSSSQSGQNSGARLQSQSSRRTAAGTSAGTAASQNRRTLGSDPYDRGQKNYSEDTAARRKTAAEQPMKTQNGKKQLSPKMKKKRRNRRILFVIEAVLLILVLAMCFVVSKWDLIKKASFAKKDVYVSELSDNTIESMEGYRNIAIFGIDENGSHSDVIVIATINNSTGEVALTSVLRDTYWNVPDPGSSDGSRAANENKFAKANNAYHTGGSLNALKALNKNLDLNITEYVEVNWVAVAETVDILGGLDIDVPETMMGEINGYITNCVEETGYPATQLTHSGLQHLQGMQVVAYCRIRHNNGGDDGRAQRHREVIAQILEQAKLVGPSVLLELCNTVFPDITTDLTLANIIAMVPNISNYTVTNMYAFPYHQIDALVDEADVKVPLGLADDVTTLHQTLFGDYSYTPSETVQEISNYIENYTGYSIDDRTD